jgi:hypothetical protein
VAGQPDSVAVSPDKTFIAITIENGRDGGDLPQMPAGYLSAIGSSSDDPLKWTVSVVELTGLDGILLDSEPEHVDINKDNIAVVTLQENNAIVLVDLSSG